MREAATQAADKQDGAEVLPVGGVEKGDDQAFAFKGALRVLLDHCEQLFACVDQRGGDWRGCRESWQERLRFGVSIE